MHGILSIQVGKTLVEIWRFGKMDLRSIQVRLWQEHHLQQEEVLQLEENKML